MGKFILGPYHSGLSIPDPAQLILPQRFARGRFRSQLVRGGGVVWDSGFHPQVMTNAFFEAYLGGSVSRAQLLAQAAVGTGTAEAAPGDTTITQHGPRANAQALESSASITGNVLTQRVQYRWAQGALTTPITEAALFQAASGGLTMVRSRLKDPAGVSTSIPVTAFDALYLTWEVDCVLNLTPLNTTAIYDGVTYDVVAKPAYWTLGATANPTACSNRFAAFASSNSTPQMLGFDTARAYATQTLGDVTAGPGGAGYVLSSAALQGSYAAGSKQRTVGYSWEGSNSVNVLGRIGSVLVTNTNLGGGDWQLSFAAQGTGLGIPKNETQRFRLDLTFTYGT